MARRAGSRARRRNLSGLRREPKFCTTRTAPSPALRRATWASAATASRTDNFVRGMELRAKYTLVAEGARGSLSKGLIGRFRAREGPRAAEVRHRPQGALAGRAGEASARICAAHVRLAARQPHRRRLIPLSLRRQSRLRRLRRASELRQPVSLALRGIPALQDASRHP